MISKPHPLVEEYCPLPFPASKGRGVRIAVIDSGVNPGHPHVNRVAGGVGIGSDGSIDEGRYLDSLGHGTAVMAAIQEKAPEAECFAVKIFDTALRAKTTALLHAIEWAVRNKMHLVNLSLGTRNLRQMDSFQSIVRLASAQGVTIVAAREAEGEPCLPGALPEVIGVALDWALHRHAYRIEESDQATVFYGSGYPRPIPGMPVVRNLNGISFAVANITGLAARACETLPTASYLSIREALLSTPPEP